MGAERALCGRKMGNMCGAQDSDAAKRNRQIETYLQSERKVVQDEIKLLLLGTGGSGKSTVAKQMKIIHLSGFTDEERVAYKNVVYHNVLRPAQTLIEQSRNRGRDFNNNEAVSLVESVNLSGNNIDFTPEIAKAVTSVWNEPSIQETYQLAAEFQLDDCAEF